jgi:hypothetical protein
MGVAPTHGQRTTQEIPRAPQPAVLWRECCKKFQHVGLSRRGNDTDVICNDLLTLTCQGGVWYSKERVVTCTELRHEHKHRS